MKANILHGHGPLAALYKAHVEGDKGFEDGDFRSEGDSPAFLHNIPTGLRNMESPDWGGWGGRFVRIRENTWLDPVAEPGYQYPRGQVVHEFGLGTHPSEEGDSKRRRIDRIPRAPMALDRGTTKRFRGASRLVHEVIRRSQSRARGGAGSPADLSARAGATLKLSAAGTRDPDGDKLRFRWWQYRDAGSYPEEVHLRTPHKSASSTSIPDDGQTGQTIHLICEVTDSGTPALTRYQRVVVTIR